MDPQEPLLEEIASGDTAKQINSLTRLINLAVNGKDISIYFNYIIQYCLVPNDHKLKLLAYRVLKKCNLIDSEWEHKVIPHIARDASGDDQNLAVAALELVHHIPASTILVDFVGKLIFIPTVNHQAPAVRRASVETLSYILLHKKAVLSSKTVVTSLWTSIVGRLLDDTSPIVFQVAFRAVSNLIDAIDNLSPIDDVDSFGDGFYETRAGLLRKVMEEVMMMLIPHFDLLVKRFDFLELSFRAPAVNVLATLSISIPRDPIAQQAKTGAHLYPVSATGAIIATIVETHLLPFLTHADDSLAFESGKAILKIWSCSESHRRDWAISATLGLVGILRRETIAISPASIITEILRVFHLIPESHLISCTLKLLISISDFTESLRRQQNLQQVFDLLAKKDLETEGNIFSSLFKDPWFISVWTTEAQFREEILTAMVTQYSQFQPRYIDTKGKTKLSDKERIAYLISSLKFIQLCNDTLKWQTGGRTHAIEQFLRFVDWQLEHVKCLPKGEDYDSIWQLQSQCLKSLMSNMTIIVSDGICLQVIFIICKYSSSLESQDEQTITSTLQHRFLLLGELSSSKDLISTASKAGTLFDISVLKVPETQYMQGVLACLHILGIRFPSMASVVSQTLSGIATCHPSNLSLVHRVKVLQSKIEASKSPSAKNQSFAFGQSVIDFSLIPPIENLDSLNKFESLNDKFALDYKKSNTTQNKDIHKHKTHSHKILSGSSDPFGIVASHLMRPDIYSIIFRVRITNQMNFAYSHLQVSIGLCGALQSGENTDASQTIKKILPEEKVDLEFPILVTGFETGSATIHLTFSSLSPGDVSLDLETSLDYDIYGKHYNATSVVSDVYEFEAAEFLRPTEYSSSEFLKEWNRFPAGFVIDVAFDTSLDKKEDLFDRLSSISDSFHNVLHWSYSEQYFQLAYSAMTWFEDQLCFTVVGQQATSSSQIFARFGFRSSDPLVLSIFHRQITRWLDLVIGVGKYALIASDPAVSMFCATAGEDEVKLGSDEMYEVEEGLLHQWKSIKYSHSNPPIPVLPSKVEVSIVAPPSLPPLPPPPPPVVEDDF